MNFKGIIIEDFLYYISNIKLWVSAGKLNKGIILVEIVNKLYRIDIEENIFDIKEFDKNRFLDYYMDVTWGDNMNKFNKLIDEIEQEIDVSEDFQTQNIQELDQTNFKLIQYRNRKEIISNEKRKLAKNVTLVAALLTTATIVGVLTNVFLFAYLVIFLGGIPIVVQIGSNLSVIEEMQEVEEEQQKISEIENENVSGTIVNSTINMKMEKLNNIVYLDQQIAKKKERLLRLKEYYTGPYQEAMNNFYNQGSALTDNQSFAETTLTIQKKYGNRIKRG